MEKTDIKSLDYDELKDFFVSIGEKPFRAKQVYQWMHEKQADGFEANFLIFIQEPMLWKQRRKI